MEPGKSNLSPTSMSSYLNEDGLSKNLSELSFEEFNDHPVRQESNENGFEVKSIDRFYTPKVVVGSEMPLLKLDEIQKLDSECTKLSQILILYTGGTIGMRKKDGAYEPEPNYLTKALRKFPMFNDTRLRQHLPCLTDMFVMPRSNDNVRVVFNVWEYKPLLDSSDMTMDDYIRISKDIEREYRRYDGFIILHGTDTMSFTGSALSFLFENLTKPVILTGSQIPLFELRSDGRENLLAALMIASHFHIPEVTLFFHEKLFRANRTSKNSSSHFNAFDSPNYPPLAELGISIQVFEHRILHHKSPFQNNNDISTNRDLTRTSSTSGLTTSHKLCANVSVLRMFPSITCATVAAFLAPPVQGVVLQTYGSGNMPFCRKDLLQLFKDAHDRNCIIINITQCWKGGVKPIYRTGFILKEYGIFPGLDMTVEAALTKLSYVLGREDWTIETKRSAMTRNLRGEMTLSHYDPIRDVRSLSQDGIFIDQECIIAAALCSNAKEGNVAMVEQLGKRRGNWEAADYDGRTALHIAASEGQLEVVRFLVEARAHLNKRDRNGFTPLRCAVMNRVSSVLIRELLAAGGELGLETAELHRKVVQAIHVADMHLLEAYMHAGVDINTQDEHGNSLLHEATMSSRSEIVRKLLDLGCNEKVNNDSGNTPVEEAVIRDNNTIVHILQSHHSLSD